MFVLSGPAGAGKTTVARRAVELLPALSLNVSCTTRSPRADETPGTSYHFLRDAEFKALVSQGEFLEWAEVHGHIYGSRASDVLEIFSRSNDALLEIDVQGGKKVRSGYPRTVLVFLVAPSLLESRNRLVGRASETEAELERRLARAKEELRESRDYDYVIVNHDPDQAAEELCCIVRAERARITGRRFDALLDDIGSVE